MCDGAEVVFRGAPKSVALRLIRELGRLASGVAVRYGDTWVALRNSGHRPERAVAARATAMVLVVRFRTDARW